MQVVCVLYYKGFEWYLTTYVCISYVIGPLAIRLMLKEKPLNSENPGTFQTFDRLTALTWD